MTALVVVALVLVLVFGAVLIVRTVRFTSRQVPVEPLVVADIDRQGAIERLSRAVQFQTISTMERDNAPAPTSWPRLNVARFRASLRVPSDAVRTAPTSRSKADCAYLLAWSWDAVTGAVDGFSLRSASSNHSGMVAGSTSCASS